MLERVANTLRQEYERDGKLKLFDALRPVLLADTPNRSYAQLASELGTTEGAIKIAVHRLRQRYGKKIREEISRTVSTPAEISGELRYLIQVVST